MPKNESWWNPYRFVPVRQDTEQGRPTTDEAFQGHCGYIQCSLTNLSLLFIGGGLGQGDFICRDLKPVIPGTSLKGMLRSLAEVVGGGCFITDRDNHCKDPDNLCITCRMFGMLSKGDVHKGQVSPGDGIFQDDRPKKKTVSIIQGRPKKEHSSFYKNPVSGDWAMDMMKMYFHQPKRTDDVFQISASLKSRAVNKQMLEPGHNFKFTVSFENLRDQELNLLLYVLALEEDVQVTLTPEGLPPVKLKGPMRHKLGNAKGQGPGSCHVLLEELTLYAPPEERFSSLQHPFRKTFTGEQLQQEVLNRTRWYHQGKDDSPTMQYLRKMMVWDPNDERVFKYPEYNWFNSDANKDIELKSI